MAELMIKVPKVVKMRFRVTDKFHEYTWRLNDDLTFAEDIPELQIDSGDKLFGVDGKDCSEKTRNDVVRLLTLKKMTTFTTITFGKKDQLNCAEIAFSTEVGWIFSFWNCWFLSLSI